MNIIEAKAKAGALGLHIGGKAVCSSKSNLKAILFDIDDTLFDRNSAQREILHIIMREFHDMFARIDEERVVSAFFESDRFATQELYCKHKAGVSADLVRTGRSRRFLKILGLNKDFADKITTLYVKSYSNVKTPVRGAEYTIRNIAKKFQLGVVSNGFPDVQYQKLKTLGINHLFDCIVVSEEIGIRKPDPRIFWKATTALAKEPEECLYVGDFHDTDIVGAKKAGMQACWFNHHRLHLSEVDVKPDYEIEDLTGLLEILGKL